MPLQRDPLSILLDDGARRLLSRLYEQRTGTWVATRLADPSERIARWAMASYEIDVHGPDDADTLSGRRMDVHGRWGRAFTRALYYQHKWYGSMDGMRERRMQPWGKPLEIEFGRRVPPLGVIPAGRGVRVRLRAGGKTALRVVRTMPDADRIYADDGEAAGRHAVRSQPWAYA